MKRLIIGLVLGLVVGGGSAHAVFKPPTVLSPERRLNNLCKVIAIDEGSSSVFPRAFAKACPNVVRYPQ